MKKLFNTIVSMVNDVLLVLDKHSVLLEGNVQAKGIIAKIKALMPNVEGHQEALVLYSKPFTKRKQELKEVLLTQAKYYVSAFRVIFSLGKAESERHRIPLIFTDIGRSSYSSFYDKMVELGNLVKLYTSDLIEAGLQPAAIEQFDQVLVEFRSLLDMPREANTQRMNARKEKEKALKQVMLIIQNELDPLIDLLGATNPELRLNYRTARRWLTPPGGRKKKKDDGTTEVTPTSLNK